MAYRLGQQSLKKLQGVHPLLIELTKKALEDSPQDFSVHDGVRTKVQQQALFDRRASKTLNSKHLIQSDGYGHAVDLVPYLPDLGLRWEWDLIYPIAAAVAVNAKQMGIRIRWGGVWDMLMSEYVLNSTGANMSDQIAACKKAVNDYCIRHPGPDFIDGPHYELA